MARRWWAAGVGHRAAADATRPAPNRGAACMGGALGVSVEGPRGGGGREGALGAPLADQKLARVPSDAGGVVPSEG